jgi:hypothetical protein
MEGKKSADDEHSVSSPAPGTRPPAPAPIEIVAPEAVPAVEQAGATPTLLAKGQPVLPEEGGVPLVTEPISIQWAEDALAAGPVEKVGGKAAAPAGKMAENALPPPLKATGKAEAPSKEVAKLAPGLKEEAVEKPRSPAGPLYPYYQPLPAQFRGTLADIRRFIGAGELMLLAGGLAFLAFSLASFGAAVVDTRHPWTAGYIADDVLWGILCIGLSAGSLLCLLLSFRKLRGAYNRNDFTALHRRLVLACAAGLVLGLFVGGVFFFLAYIKVDELPVIQEVKSSKGGQKTGEPVDERV